jgi:hypothetical protein
MELDPHALHEIVRRIDRQMRCPQCGKQVPVDFSSVRVTGDDFLLLQLKCVTCDAFIVLHAALGNAEVFNAGLLNEKRLNISSTLHLKEDEIALLQDAIRQNGGSFQQVFKKYGKK